LWSHRRGYSWSGVVYGDLIRADTLGLTGFVGHIGEDTLGLAAYGDLVRADTLGLAGFVGHT